MKFDRILVIAAHPDDEVLGCGGTICKLAKEGKHVKILFLGEGSSCRFPREKINSLESLAATQERRRFADAAMVTLKITDTVFVDLPCGRFDTISIIDIAKIIEECIADFSPDTVFTHAPNDTNNDHRLTFQATLQATRPVPNYPVRNLLSYEVLSSSEWHFTETFRPNFFICIDEEIDDKIRAFNCYAHTEARSFPFPRCTEGLIVAAKNRGMQIGHKHAEAFIVIRSILP